MFMTIHMYMSLLLYITVLNRVRTSVTDADAEAYAATRITINQWELPTNTTYYILSSCKAVK